MVILWMPQAHSHSSGNSTDEALIVYNNLGVEGYDLPSRKANTKQFTNKANTH